ncbi:MAG: hypothetical protein AAF940_01115 [Pseudomonadota bacterium]
MLRRLAPSLIALLTSATAVAAKNTNEDWKWASEYYATYGEWTVACDHRSDDETVKRCYLRYVDAYARDPFGALFVFVTRSGETGLRFNFEYERGVRFTAPWSVTENETPVYAFDPAGCPSGSECPIGGDEASEMAEAFSAANRQISFALTDRSRRAFNLAWPTDGFAEALDDLTTQSEARNLQAPTPTGPARP